MHVKASLETIWLSGAYLALIMISDNIRKNMLAMFSPRFRRSPNPGLAGESKPRGRSVKAGLGAQRRQWVIC